MKRIIQSDSSLRLSFIYENGKISALAMPTKQLAKQSKRPTLEVLQKFTNSYFKRNPPKVKWHRFPDGIVGDAVFKNNSIRLSLSMAIDNLGCAVGFLSYIPESEIILEEGEQYFLYLLHEIGHFKITKKCRIKVPSEYKELKRILHQQGITKKGVRDPEKVISIIERYVRKHFEDEYVAGTIEDFKTYFLYGDFVAHHSAVENWAIKKFENRREEIREILGYVS